MDEWTKVMANGRMAKVIDQMVNGKSYIVNDQMVNVPNDILIPEMQRLIESGHRVEFTPTGVSMRPFIEGGSDSVVLARADGVRVGDILLCRVGDRYVLHRLIALHGDLLTLMGDGNLSGMEHCLRRDVIARVVEIRTRNGRRKPLTRGRLWHRLLPIRALLLKITRRLKIKD